MIEKKALKFWFEKSNLINWKKKPKKIIKIKKNKFQWFPDGTLNVAENCIGNNIKKGMGNKNAIIYLKENGEEQCISYNQLNILVKNFSYFISKNLRIKNSHVMIHGSASLETAVSMLACANIGLNHCVIFEELEKEAILKRMNIVKPKLFISKTSNKKLINFLKKQKKKNDYKLLFFGKNGNIALKDFTKINYYKKKNLKYFKSNNKLFTLFTSGSTGEPKGIIHSSAGYLIYAKYTCIKQFGINKNSTFLCASDAGWINGHTYSLYGPLSIGATTVILEKPTMILNTNKLKKYLLKYKVTILYLPVTLIRMMKAYNINLKIKSAALKTLGSMGEPLAKNVASWFAKAFNLKKKSIVNTYFQTETGGIICSPRYNQKSNTFGTVGKPINKNIKLNLKKYSSKKNNIENYLKIKNIWPGCMIDVCNGDKIWKKYWDNENNFNLFDVASLDKNNNILIHGRNDDVINIRGHRVGSGEIESTILEIVEISEVCAVPIEDLIEGNRLCIFCVSKKSNYKIKEKINIKLNNSFGSFAIPKEIFFVNAIPKTRSGKIMRRILRIMLNKSKENLGDMSTILDKKPIIDIQKKINKYSLRLF